MSRKKITNECKSIINYKEESLYAGIVRQQVTTRIIMLYGSLQGSWGFCFLVTELTQITGFQSAQWWRK